MVRSLEGRPVKIDDMAARRLFLSNWEQSELSRLFSAAEVGVSSCRDRTSVPWRSVHLRVIYSDEKVSDLGLLVYRRACASLTKLLHDEHQIKGDSECIVSNSEVMLVH